MRKIWLAVMIALFLYAPSSHAEDLTKRAKVKEMFVLTSMEDRIMQTKAVAVAQSKAYATQMLASLGLPETEAKDATKFYEALYAVIATKYDWQKLEPSYEQIYVDLYTEDEIDGILAFYKSPVGRALLAKTPLASKQMLQVSQQQFESLTPQIQQLTADYVARLKAEATPSK